MAQWVKRLATDQTARIGFSAGAESQTGCGDVPASCPGQTDLTLPSSTKVKTVLPFTSIPPIRTAVVGHRRNFTFLFLRSKIIPVTIDTICAVKTICMPLLSVFFQWESWVVEKRRQLQRQSWQFSCIFTRMQQKHVNTGKMLFFVLFISSHIKLHEAVYCFWIDSFPINSYSVNAISKRFRAFN
jgi:hypothetical protein